MSGLSQRGGGGGWAEEEEPEGAVLQSVSSVMKQGQCQKKMKNKIFFFKKNSIKRCFSVCITIQQGQSEARFCQK